MRRLVFSLIGLACFAGSAMATTHDTFSFTSQVSNGTNGSALNQVSTASTLNSYPVARVRVNGTLLSGGVNSYEAEARILVTPPSGPAFTLQPFSQSIPFTSITTPEGGYVYDLPPGFPNSHGTWTFRFYESFDDPGIDATWQNITFTIDDGTTNENIEAHPTAPPAIIGLSPSLISLYLVPGLNPNSTGMAATVDLSAVGGSATQTLYDDGTNGDAVAGDHFYSFGYAPTTSVAEGTYTINYHVTDAQTRNLYGSFPLQVQGMTVVDPITSGWETFYSGMNIPAGGAHWFKLTVSHSIADASHTWFDAWTTGPVGGDTEIALYNSSGTLVTIDDDDADGYLSALSFGQVSPTRNRFSADGIACNGRDGSLAAGTYYLAMGTYPMTFAQTGFVATGTGAACVNGGIDFALDYDLPTVYGYSVVTHPQGTVVVTAGVIAAEYPVSQGMAVTADLSALGGPAGTAMYDDGTHGDQFAGDGIFSLTLTIQPAYGEGAYNIPLVVTDSLARQGTGAATVNVDLAGDSIATAWPLGGSGPVLAVSGALTSDDVDMYRIHICNPAGFSARVTGGTLTDPQLFLFRPDGMGVVANDDDPAGGLLSVLNGPLATSIPAGDYYLAISGWDKDPVDSGQQLMWQDTPFTLIHAPDGPGGSHPLAGWNNTGSGMGTYVISFTGVTGSSCRPSCGSADFNCDGDIGTDSDISAFFGCLAGACPPPPCTSTADFNGDGDLGTDADIEAFFRVLAGGSC